MMHALIRDGQIIETRYLRETWYDGTRYWDFSELGHDPADHGWLPIVYADRPADTDTHTHDYGGVELVEGVPTQVWVERAWTQTEIDTRAEQAARLDDLEAKVAILWAAVFPPDPEPEPGEPVTAPEFSGIWHPGHVISDGGKTWRNVSGVPLTTAPSGFPGSPSQWGHLFVEVTSDPDPEPEPGDRPAGYVGPWDPDATYAIGDVVDRDGRYYRCKVPHGAEYQGTWGPPQASVWDDIGPVA